MKKINNFIKKFNNITRKDVKFCDVTSFGIGGEISAFCEPKNIKELKEVLHYLNKLKIDYFLLGNGTNILASDKKYNGVVIRLREEFEKIEIEDDVVVCGAGVNLFFFNRVMANNSLSGTEFSYGIPGTMGGAVCMNAGAFGGDIGSYVEWVEIINNGKIIKYFKNNCNFSYRNSIFLQKKLIITKICLKLTKGNKEEISQKQNDFLIKRKNTQPVGFRSAGSVFRREESFVPAKIIDELGLKGKIFGDAMVSKIHAGFIVNLGRATCQDVLNLVSYISNEVKLRTNLDLKLEILLVGDL